MFRNLKNAKKNIDYKNFLLYLNINVIAWFSSY